MTIKSNSVIFNFVTELDPKEASWDIALEDKVLLLVIGALLFSISCMVYSIVRFLRFRSATYMNIKRESLCTCIQQCYTQIQHCFERILWYCSRTVRSIAIKYSWRDHLRDDAISNLADTGTNVMVSRDQDPNGNTNGFFKFQSVVKGPPHFHGSDNGDNLTCSDVISKSSSDNSLFEKCIDDTDDRVTRRTSSIFSDSASAYWEDTSASVIPSDRSLTPSNRPRTKIFGGRRNFYREEECYSDDSMNYEQPIDGLKKTKIRYQHISKPLLKGVNPKSFYKEHVYQSDDSSKFNPDTDTSDTAKIRYKYFKR